MRVPTLLALAALAAAAMIAASSCHADAGPAARKPAVLFDDWPPGPNHDDLAQIFGSWASSDKGFVITSQKSGRDSDALVLIGRTAKVRNEVVLGYGLRAVDVKWFETKAGSVAVVNHFIDNGINELFVLMPRMIGRSTSWDLLYKTPSRSAAGSLTVAHCYWTLIRLDPELGIMQLKGAWDFSEPPRVMGKKILSEATYRVPLFYGFAIK
jgi:hypothetical protein